MFTLDMLKQNLTKVLGESEIKKIDKFISVLKNVDSKLKTEYFEYTNLKLHDISYKSDSDDYAKYFDCFCEDNFEIFTEYKDWLGLGTKRLGRTSSFKFQSDDWFYLMFDEHNMNNHVEISYKELILVWIETCYSGYTEIEKVCNFECEMTAEDIDEIETDELVDEIDFVIGDEVNTIEEIEKYKKMYEYLTSFMDKQMEYWNEFIANEKANDDCEE